jgi:glycosyltransferase involved in cell wall biosynthesis
MSRLKVAHITTVDISLRYLLLNQMSAIGRRGYEVVGMSAPGAAVAEVEGAGIRHIAIPMTRRSSPLSDLAALWRLWRVLRRERFGIVHTHTPKAGLLGQYAAALARVPIRLHTIHGLYFPGHIKASRRWLYVLLERLTMRFSHLNLSQNPEDVPVAIAERICAPERIRLIGNGIDLAAFDPASQPPGRRQATRAGLGLDERHKVVGMVARFVAEKGYRELLQAARVIARRRPDVRFLLIGPLEPMKADALDPGLIAAMGVDHVVQFLGHRTDVADLYAIMDVLALPSYREGYPRAPMEAAALGVPTVATEIRGCRQVVEDGVTGYLVPPRDAGALTTALLDLLEDDQKRRAFGRAARAKALAEFDERVVFDRVVAAYEDLLGRRPAPAATDVAGVGR